MQIHGASFIGTQPVFPTVTAPAPEKKPGGAGAEFGQAVRQAVDSVDHQQQKASVSIQDLLTGNGDILPVVAEVAKADMSFKLLMAVRNKVIEAYKQTINMQI
jgi:flagellar hook-basal body complex protein FliE